MAKIVNSWNEWDPLKRVIVGKADGSRIPYPEPAYEVFNPVTMRSVETPHPIPAEEVDKANEQMDYFVKVMEDRGIIVDRVTPIDFSKKISISIEHIDFSRKIENRKINGNDRVAFSTKQ